MSACITTKGGRELTEADIERLANEIGSDDFDLKGWTPRPGRPPLEVSSTDHSPRIAVSGSRPRFGNVLNCVLVRRAEA